MPLVLDLVSRVDEQQKIPEARGRLTVDRWLRVAGAPGVFALGDCSFLADTPYPATAQVASQQGYYLGRLFNRGYDFGRDVPSGGGGDLAKPFQFLNLGVLAYTGQGKALAQIEAGKSKFEQTGTVGWVAWRAVYLSKQVSARNQFMVIFDWLKTYFFGRDLTRF
uniref:NADH:ubiquinone reductase (non-electrogenic) n=3 Tax=Hemiselmis andersenii TaxID=464988 RepID=A0A7S0TNS3_HEMAN